MGIELVPRDYDMDSPQPFQKADIVSLVPVHKVKKHTMLFDLVIPVFEFYLLLIMDAFFFCSLLLTFCSKQHAHLLMDDNSWNHQKQL